MAAHKVTALKVPIPMCLLLALALGVPGVAAIKTQTPGWVYIPYGCCSGPYLATSSGTVEECQTECENTAGCVAFQRNGNTCYLDDNDGDACASRWRDHAPETKAIAIAASWHCVAMESAWMTWSGVLGLPPTPQPTPAPTSHPTASPTSSGSSGSTGSSAASSGSSAASAKGDPHLQNINGQRFDLMRPGRHVLLHIPRGAGVPHVMLRVEAEVQRLGTQCGDMYFQHLNITGAWVEAKHKGILQFQAGETGGEEEPAWMAFGAVYLKVVRAHGQGGIHYLNLFAKHLGKTGFTVGGLLGEDDHTYEATPDPDCKPTLSLHGTKMESESIRPSAHAASSAEASLA